MYLILWWCRALPSNVNKHVQVIAMGLTCVRQRLAPFSLTRADEMRVNVALQAVDGFAQQLLEGVSAVTLLT